MKSIFNSILCTINRKVKVLNQCFSFYQVFFCLTFPQIFDNLTLKKHLFISIMLRKKGASSVFSDVSFPVLQQRP